MPDLSREIADLLREGDAITPYAFERYLMRADGPIATALAEAKAQARRDAFEEAATKAEGQLAYWRERMRAEKCLDHGISEDGETYTPIGDVAAWQGGSCNGRMSEAEWWISTLRTLATAPAETEKPETGEGASGSVDPG